MSIKNIYNHRKPVIGATIVPLLIFLLWIPSEAKPAIQKQPYVRNPIHLEINQESAIITYDLVGDPSGTYEIVATLVKEGDPNFHILLKSATGDIGKGKFAGNGRRIQWDYKKDLPKDFTGGPEYSVEISVRQVEEESGGGSWVYYVLGGAVIAGGVVYLARPKPSSEATTPTSTLPSSPPGRPSF